jgi:ABC-type transport system involved in Fe-S cluster assembly fused permease/ATPase subunit
VKHSPVWVLPLVVANVVDVLAGRNASRIVVMETGRIVGIGSHAGLLQAGGSHSRLHGLQFGSEAAAPA